MYFITYQDAELTDDGLSLKKVDAIKDVYDFIEDMINNHYYNLLDFTVVHGLELVFETVKIPIKVMVKS